MLQNDKFDFHYQNILSEEIGDTFQNYLNSLNSLRLTFECFLEFADKKQTNKQNQVFCVDP